MSQLKDKQCEKLLPRWECKYDRATGKCYYANYFTKTMQLVDPRQGYHLLQNNCCSNESIALQKSENSSLFMLKSTPKQTLTPQFMPRRATIQETSLSSETHPENVVQKIQNMFPTASGNHIRLLLKKYYNREAVVISALQVEKHPVTMPGPFVTPPAQRNVFHNNSVVCTPPIGCRYVTHGNLTQSYNNSRSASPAISGRLDNARYKESSQNVSQTSCRTVQGTCKLTEDICSSSKAHSSPKMKLRYMKAVFPQAEETLIFDILANADNNVQKASDKLISIGYSKRQTPTIKGQRHMETEQQTTKKVEHTNNMQIHPKEYTREEKDFIKEQLSEKCPSIAERILLMALESVNYAQDRAVKILQIVQEEDAERQIAEEIVKHPSNDVNTKQNLTTRSEVLESAKQIECVGIDHTFHLNGQNEYETDLQSTPIKLDTSSFHHYNAPLSLMSSLASSVISTNSTMDCGNINGYSVSSYLHGPNVTRPLWKTLSTHSRIKLASPKSSQSNVYAPSVDNLCKEFKSLINYSLAKGPDNHLAKGANENLLLADYIIWNGANPDLHKGQKHIAVGPDAALRTVRTYKACGHNVKHSKGPQAHLVKGSRVNPKDSK